VAGGYRVYLMDISYFSGKLEAYLRYKRIPYERIEVGWWRLATELRRKTGMVKVPLVETPDGQWLQDTTPMIDWFETYHPRGRVLPEDAYQAFFCRLLEDYADEWLWRSALHYRWSYRADARLLGGRIANEVMKDVPLPAFLKARVLRRRQRAVYVRGDGVTQETRTHVEGIYTGTLSRLETILSSQPYLLGARPCLADFGFFAAMFRHFALDPTPSRIMRDTAPAVYAWVARLWNARFDETKGEWATPGTLPQGWGALIRDAGETYLPYLHANALAWREGRRRHDFDVQRVSYRNVPTVRYRVWCRERLQQHLAELPEEARASVRRTLEECGAWEPLHADGTIPSRLHQGASPPLCTPSPRRGRWGFLRSQDPWNPRA